LLCGNVVVRFSMSVGSVGKKYVVPEPNEVRSIFAAK
jgi:hypothetical protein